MSSRRAQDQTLLNRLTAEDGQLRRQQLEGFAQHTPINSTVSLVNSLIAVIMLWDTVPKVFLLTWLGLIWAFSLLRLQRWWHWRSRAAEQADRKPKPVRRATLHKAAAWALAAGLIWGSSVGFDPYLSPDQRLLIAIVIAAMAAGAATTLGAIPLAAGAFIIAAIMPWAVYFAWIGDHIHIGLACFALIMTLAMLISTSIVHKSFMEAIRARHRNSVLVRQIRDQRSEWLEISDTSEAFALFDEEERLLLWNENYRRILSLSKDQLFRGAKRRELLRLCAAPISVTRGEESIDQWIERQVALSQGDKEPQVEQLSNGRWLKSIARETGRGHTATVHVDITELKKHEAELLATQAELRLQSREVQRAYDQLGLQHRKIEETTEELRRARDSAMAASRAKTEFLANMSHELRTPLNAVIGFSELLGREAFGPLGSERYESYVKHIHDSGEHLLNLINDLLDLSIIEAGELQLSEEPVNMTEVVRLCCQLVRNQAERAEVALSVTGNLEDWPQLRADGTKLRQIVLNLLSNAIKFTPARGSVVLDLSGGWGAPFRIEVTDTGIGMRPEDIPSVLEPFRRLTPAHSADYQGAGLGLPLTKALVELHGGELAISSVLGEGTTVTITLPPGMAYDQGPAPSARAASATPGSA
ncbi:hypothetical protein HBA54_06125 [Pelagibius litoralis]|uniref:histidine kinase n=1 Tax=Pelagibius litoralis TaxID=374515 RepID=A0A967EWS8_9PROT|nr:ATP-binding protein [Pelagibius litoralis]NIA68163.1 hypothetical protein [Pelagibius litoralis]